MLSGGNIPLALGVLQILALDIGTDTLSAVALGAEPPSNHLIEAGPVRGRLMNRTVVRRAFGVLGPVIAVLTMLAWGASLLGAGWRPGEPWPDDSVLAAASGAAFVTVVLGQVANAFACRSSTRRPWELGWTSNRLLLVAIPIDLAFALAVLSIDPIADTLDQAWPTWWGWLVAVSAMPIVLMVDTFDKAVRTHRGASSGRTAGQSVRR
jgi:magnesium-transporting ATPase (P-type)